MKNFGTAAILCGGKSTRMGFDKCMLKVNNKLLINIIGEKLEEEFKEIILISDDVNKFKGSKYKVIQDEIPNLGPIGAIYTALKESSSRYVFVTACDMPVVNLEYIKFMMKTLKSQPQDGVVSYNYEFIEPLYSFYSTNMRSLFEREINKNNFKLFDVIKSANMCYIEDKKVREYCSKISIFTNLNYKADIASLERILAEGK